MMLKLEQYLAEKASRPVLKLKLKTYFYKKYVAPLNKD